jgi:hypothetical protein
MIYYTFDYTFIFLYISYIISEIRELKKMTLEVFSTQRFFTILNLSGGGCGQARTSPG